jgi:hypothetical protein
LAVESFSTAESILNQKQREAEKARYEARMRCRDAQVEGRRRAEERARGEALIDSTILVRRAKQTRRERRPALCATPACLDTIRRRAPRLIDPPWDRALVRLLQLPRVRPIEQWRPRGKGRDCLFRSLADHLLARFPVPAVVWNAFHHPNADQLVPLAVHVARGGSLADFVKTSLAIPLSRRMCHELLQTSSEYELLAAIRRVQARAAGGDERFFQAWRTTRFAQQIGSRDDEAFWYTVVEWFAKVPDLPTREIAPLCDWIDHRRREDAAFTMKGRTGTATIRAMKEWHGALAKTKGIPDTVFRSSGIADGDVLDSRRGPKGETIPERWQIKELLTARALAEEGQRMQHCVYSYAWRIESGGTSIWSVQMEDSIGVGTRHFLTIEVQNDIRRIVQMKGRFNRGITKKELSVITKWAAENNLKFGK